MEFHQQGFPSIVLSDHFFEIRGDNETHWERFHYSEINAIHYDKSALTGMWWMSTTTFNWNRFYGPFRLILVTNRDVKYRFKTYRNENTELKEILREISRRCKETESSKD